MTRLPASCSRGATISAGCTPVLIVRRVHHDGLDCERWRCSGNVHLCVKSSGPANVLRRRRRHKLSVESTTGDAVRWARLKEVDLVAGRIRRGASAMISNSPAPRISANSAGPPSTGSGFSACWPALSLVVFIGGTSSRTTTMEGSQCAVTAALPMRASGHDCLISRGTDRRSAHDQAHAGLA